MTEIKQLEAALMRGWFALCAAILLAGPAPAVAADFPTRPIKLIIPFATGGAVTFLTEHVMKEMEAELGQPIIRDYRGGAGGTIAMEMAASAPADGYTMFVVSTSQAISAGVYDGLKVDITKDFAPVDTPIPPCSPSSCLRSRRGAIWTTKPETTLNISFTYTGLAALGVPAPLLELVPHGVPRRHGCTGGCPRRLRPSDPSAWEAGFGTGEIHTLCTTDGSTNAALDASISPARADASTGTGCTWSPNSVASGCWTAKSTSGHADGVGQPSVWQRLPRLR